MDPLLIAGITAGSSLVGEIFGASERRKQRQQTIDAYKKLLIPYTDIKQRADRVGDTVYTKAMNELNSGAFQYAGALNSNTLSALAISKMIEARTLAQAQSEEGDNRFNRDIQSKIAEAEAISTPGINIANVLEQGFGGYLAGKQLGMTENLNKSLMEYYDLLKPTSNVSQNSSNNNSNNTIQTAITSKKNTYNPFDIENKPKLELKVNTSYLENNTEEDILEFDFFRKRRKSGLI